MLLIGVAERLTAILRPADTLARRSGDEFVVLCEDIGAQAHVEPLALRIGAALAEPLTLSGTEVAITASFGIALAGPGSEVLTWTFMRGDDGTRTHDPLLAKQVL